MEVYVALYRRVDWARLPGNTRSSEVLRSYWEGKENAHFLAGQCQDPL
jgi:hypothetical protein